MTNASDERRSLGKCLTLGPQPRRYACPISLRCWALKSSPRRSSRWTHRFAADAPSRRSRSSFLRESLNQPLILIFEDLHWIDGETQGFLDVLSESVASAKLLLLTNYRPEYRHEWGQKTYYTQLRLAPFGKAEAEEFLDACCWASRVGADGQSPLQHLKQLILEKPKARRSSWKRWSRSLLKKGVLAGATVGAAHAARSTQHVADVAASHDCARDSGRPH